MESVAVLAEAREIPIDSFAVWTGESSGVVRSALAAIYAVVTVAAIRWHSGGRNGRAGNHFRYSVTVGPESAQLKLDT